MTPSKALDCPLPAGLLPSNLLVLRLHYTHNQPPQLLLPGLLPCILTFL